MPENGDEESILVSVPPSGCINATTLYSPDLYRAGLVREYKVLASNERDGYSRLSKYARECGMIHTLPAIRRTPPHGDAPV
jgi:hypothetical protein